MILSPENGCLSPLRFYGIIGTGSCDPRRTNVPVPVTLVPVTLKSADAAIEQIDLKDYASKFALCDLPIVKVGINFDLEKRTIGEWKTKIVG